MQELMPDGDDVRRAVKWVSSCLQEDSEQPVRKLVEEAVFKFNLSPRDAEFMATFFREHKQGA